MGVNARRAIRALGSIALGVILWSQAMACAAAQSPPVAIGWVELVASPQRKDHLTVIGHVYGAEASSGRFTLSVSRVGKGGTSTSQQAGAFSVAAGESKTLSTTTINVTPAASLKIELRLYSGDKEIFSVVMQPNAEGRARDI